MHRTPIYLYPLALLVVYLLQGRACAQTADTAKTYYTLYLMGDAGERDVGNTSTMKLFKKTLDKAPSHSAVVFLGDNIYPRGMPPEEHPLHEDARKSIDAQLNAVSAYTGRTFFIPGNHDWAKGHKEGRNYLKNQETYVESMMGGKDVFLPSDACPGPVEIPLHKDITLIIMDTQWFLHPWDKPGDDEGGCAAASSDEAWQQLHHLLRKNKGKHLIVASHHPMLTYGIHGGISSFQDHLFPLTRLNKSLYLPLPVIGSIYPLYRKYFGNIQDTSHPTYKSMKKLAMSLFSEYPGLIHVAGHEHALQYSKYDSTHYVVSGAGSKTTPTKARKEAQFAKSEKGFARLDFYTDGRVKLTFLSAKKSDGSARALFEKNLYQKKSPAEKHHTTTTALPDFADSTITVSASDRYDVGKLQRYLFGNNYRKAWSQKIPVPVFDIGREKGGLEIIQRGGGMQTKSLRMKDKQGKQYVLRSIEKFPENAVPEILRKTFAQDIVQDQISAAHPYGAFIIAPMAEAAGICHTNPRLVYIPDDPRFGEHQKDFKGTLALYEERPAKDRSDIASFGRSKKIISTAKVLAKIQDDNDNHIDQQFALRSRLFDLLIADWDRHDDQWRWASFKKGKGETYRPIPRDRDQAFFLNEGPLPKIWSRKWALPKFEGFNHSVRFPSGLMFNARYFDRTFLTEPSLEDWLNTARSIREDLDDVTIENAVKQWPEEVYALDGEEVIAKLKSRRNRLEQYAKAHYLYLSKAVDVVGSDKMEHFIAERLENGDIKVEVKKISKKGDLRQTLYQRHFKFQETKEIRLWGQGGKDVFKITGGGKKGIKIRIIGGQGQDEVEETSKVGGASRKTLFYDTKSGNTVINKGSEYADKTSYDPKVNDYDRKAFKYNLLVPLLTANFNPDDGIFLGGGLLNTTHGFRKKPFKSQHLVLGAFAFNTSSYDFQYKGKFTDIVGKWRMEIGLDIKAPNFVNNFFGLGNESNFDQKISDDPQLSIKKPIQFYRLRFKEITSSIQLVKALGEKGQFSFGPRFQIVEIENPERETYIKRVAAHSAGQLLENPKHFTGGTVALEFDTRKDKARPVMGTVWENELIAMAGLDEDADDYMALNSSLAFYHSFRLPARITFATRFGAGFNFGDYEFYMAQTLGGGQQLRGFRKTRFYGDKKFYSNTEVRLKLADVKTYLFPVGIGLLGFHDLGRIWYKDTSGRDPSSASGKSGKWHSGMGIGLWFSPFNKVVLSTEMGVSEEETLFYVRLGHLF